MSLEIHVYTAFHAIIPYIQLSVLFNEDSANIPGGYKSVTQYFRKLLTKARNENPLCLLLDGVDQLSPEDGASGMSWLPLSLPPNVKIVLSTTSEVQYRCLPVLQSLLSEYQQNFLQVANYMTLWFILTQ